MVTRVLVVDDSPLARGLIGEIIGGMPGWEVAGYARDGVAGANELARLEPDVVTLDLEMPRMGGLKFLESVLPTSPVPVVVVSSIAKEGRAVTLRALSLGAVDFVTKPVAASAEEFEVYSHLLRAKLQAAAIANRAAIRAVATRTKPALLVTQQLQPLGSTPPRTISVEVGGVIAIGASAGGPMAVRTVLEGLPAQCPPVVIAQHMPAPFTEAFARRLGTDTAIQVMLAVDGTLLQPGTAYVAPGDGHMQVLAGKEGYRLAVKPGAALRQHRPSVDVLFESVAAAAGSLAVGAVLTGMGDDGARGVAAIKRAGGYVIAQDEATSAIYGMPKMAVATGCVDQTLALREIAQACVQAASRVRTGG
jgi:two-component system, chemotaxis family, protein-glutamate methylesterase/glutaminase